MFGKDILMWPKSLGKRKGKLSYKVSHVYGGIQR